MSEQRTFGAPAWAPKRKCRMLRFRHLVEQRGLTQATFAAVRGLLEVRRLLLREGTIVDATTIAAPSSTKNARRAHEP